MRAVRLADVCDVLMGQAPPGEAYNDTGDGWPLVAGAGDFSSGRIAAKKFTTAAPRRTRVGDIVLGVRASIGAKVLSDGEYCLGRGVAALRARDELDERFLWHGLTHLTPALRAKGRGATFPQVTRSDIEELVMPLPPIGEQRRIAAILDHADVLRGKRKASLALLDTLTESIFGDMFGDPLSNPRCWDSRAVLGDVADVVSGITKGRRTTAATRNVPYLAVANVQDGHLKLEHVKSIDATEDEIRRYLLADGDLVLTEGGDPDKLGRGTVWRGELRECIHQNHVFRVRLDTRQSDPTFVSALLASERGRRYFLRSAKQTTGIASINSTQLRRFPMLVPPLNLQRTFATATASLSTTRLRKQRAEVSLDELFASLQHRAFSGQL